jgi:hypothetical protein
MLERKEKQVTEHDSNIAHLLNIHFDELPIYTQEAISAIMIARRNFFLEIRDTSYESKIYDWPLADIWAIMDLEERRGVLKQADQQLKQEQEKLFTEASAPLPGRYIPVLSALPNRMSAPEDSKRKSIPLESQYKLFVYEPSGWFPNPDKKKAAQALFDAMNGNIEALKALNSADKAALINLLADGKLAGIVAEILVTIGYTIERGGRETHLRNGIEHWIDFLLKNHNTNKVMYESRESKQSPPPLQASPAAPVNDTTETVRSPNAKSSMFDQRAASLPPVGKPRDSEIQEFYNAL